MKGLDYKYQPSWRLVLKTLSVFHRVAGKRCHVVMAQVHFTEDMVLCLAYISLLVQALPGMCSLQSLPEFKWTAELEDAVGVAIATMGPQLV